MREKGAMVGGGYVVLHTVCYTACAGSIWGGNDGQEVGVLFFFGCG